MFARKIQSSLEMLVLQQTPLGAEETHLAEGLALKLVWTVNVKSLTDLLGMRNLT
jgi:hypothetical protein